MAGFPLFNESRPLGSGQGEAWLEQLEQKLFGFAGEYDEFLREKASRGISDTYAAFQPFNESTRALYPFLPLLRECLRPGDFILDTWCRTGWSGEMLAGLFPEQRVISMWEGNSNVLGYRGFAHWLGEGARHSNLDIIFTHPDHALPLKTGGVRVLHGLDSLHRYRHLSFIPECLRVCAQDGVLIFPHIHLTNSQPVPFFERGCQQYHGSEWRQWLDELLAGGSRGAWILPEAGLFEAEDEIILQDHSETKDYNALVLIAGTHQDGRSLGACDQLPIRPDSRFVENPLLRSDPHLCQVSLDPESMAAQTATMLDRHPCYRGRLLRVSGSTLSGDEGRFLWHARQGLDLQSIANAMELSVEAATVIGSGLCRRELVHAAPVSRAMALLQRFFATMKLPDATPLHFPAVWRDALPRYGDRAVLRWLEDSSELQADEVSFLVDAVRTQLKAEGLVPGSRVLLSTQHHPEALLVCWAAWLQGITVVIVDAALPYETIAGLKERSGATLCFTDDIHVSASLTARCIIFDGATAASDVTFTDWLEKSLDGVPPPPVEDPDAAAVVLFTSGSTGFPKGVVLSQRALCTSGQTMSETHRWQQEVLLSLGPLSMMSGLRNPAVAALVSASTILLPDRATRQLPLTAWQQACNEGATVITSVPVWLSSILQIADRLERPVQLKQVLLTGTSLGAAQRKEAGRKFGVAIGDYYGLTETGGICTAALEEDDAGTLGRPVNALVQILDDDGLPVAMGRTGHVRVHSNQLMAGYLDDPDATARVLRNGWLYTGDLAHWDASGRLVLDGRADELIKLRNGMRFHPIELESVLNGLEDVESSAVLVTGEKLDLIALVVSTADPRKIYEGLAEKVAAHLLPARIVAVPGFPISSNGKLIRSRLHELLHTVEETASR